MRVLRCSGSRPALRHARVPGWLYVNVGSKRSGNLVIYRNSRCILVCVVGRLWSLSDNNGRGEGTLYVERKQEATLEMAMMCTGAPAKITCLRILPLLPSSSRTRSSSYFFKPVHCAPLQQVQEEQADLRIMCEPCDGKGWVVCDFCEGQKTNVKAENKRIYRRCPRCRAVGYVLCQKCKVFKCVTFPNYSDGEELFF